MGGARLGGHPEQRGEHQRERRHRRDSRERRHRGGSQRAELRHDGGRRQRGRGTVSGQVLTATSPTAASWSFGLTSVMTTLGDMIFENSAPAPARLAGPTGAGLWLLTSAPSGGTAQAPAWAQGITLAGYLAPAVVSPAFGTPVTVNAALGNVFKVTLTASGGSISNPTSAVDGEIIRFRLTQDSSGTRTIAWGPQYDWGSTGGAANSAPTLTTAAGKTDVLAFEYNAAGTAWMYLGAAIPQGF